MNEQKDTAEIISTELDSGKVDTTPLTDRAEQNTSGEMQNKASSCSQIVIPKDNVVSAGPSCKDCKVGRGYRPFLDYVELCPIHAAAPALAEQLRARIQALLTSDASKEASVDEFRAMVAEADNETSRLKQAIGWIVDAADAAYIEDENNERIHEIFNIAAKASGITRRLPDENHPFEL